MRPGLKIADGDSQLRRIVVGFRRGILGKGRSNLMCYAVCAPLASLLPLLGYPVELIEGEVDDTEHYWLRRPDGRIIDPTADQFSRPDRPMPKVYMGKLPDWYITVGARPGEAGKSVVRADHKM